MVRRLAAVSLLALALTACAPTSGAVVEKRYDDPDTWVTWHENKSTTCSGTGSKRTCHSITTGRHPIRNYDPAHWEFKLDDGKDSGWVEVDERTYNNVPIGSVYNQKTGRVES